MGLAYSNYGYAGYPYAAGYAAYPYAGVYGAGYNGYATGYRYLGKRSADSESDAKPWLTYANYGYPYASTYGAYAGAYAAAPAVYGGGYGSYGYSAYRPYTYGRVYGAYNGYY